MATRLGQDGFEAYNYLSIRGIIQGLGGVPGIEYWSTSMERGPPTLYVNQELWSQGPKNVGGTMLPPE